LENGGFQSKLTEVQQLSKIAADTVAQYIKRILENHGLVMKCISFAGDNWNTMSEGLRRKAEGGKVCLKNS
jgi:molybdopterin-biosynthesis enzyme MoeA-like protein